MNATSGRGHALRKAMVFCGVVSAAKGLGLKLTAHYIFLKLNMPCHQKCMCSIYAIINFVSTSST